MSDGEPAGRPPDVSDDEIVNTVMALIEASDSPVVERILIQEKLGYSEPTTRKRLNSLVEEGRIGRYDASGVHVFWVGDASHPGGEATSPDIITDIESIEPEDMSQEKAREIATALLSDYQPKTIYHNLHDYGDAFLRWGIVGFAIGLMLLLNDTILSNYISPILRAQIVVAGFGIVIVGGVIQIASIIGEKVSERRAS